ncbi:MAG: hypothetical protein L0220_08865 [Acidobacteria bacterium]|nr:hypothetical protein [Acidobacteriota bacterium]
MGLILLAAELLGGGRGNVSINRRSALFYNPMDRCPEATGLNATELNVSAFMMVAKTMAE